MKTSDKKIKDLEKEKLVYLQEMEEKEQCINLLEQKLQTVLKEKEILTN